MNFPKRQFIRIFRTDVTNFKQFSIFDRALAYKSAYSLDKLYPKSNLKLYTPNFVPEDPKAKFNGYIPLEELEITYCRSSGPGGQHVNRTNSKVDVRFHVKNAKWLSDDIKENLLKQEQKITKGGFLCVKSELTRSQQLNLADALEKLRKIIRECVKEPIVIPPESQEYKRKLLLQAARKRLFEKRKRSEIQRMKTEYF